MTFIVILNETIPVILNGSLNCHPERSRQAE